MEVLLEQKLETGTPLDNILKDGIPQGKITMMVGKSNIGSLTFNKIKTKNKF